MHLVKFAVAVAILFVAEVTSQDTCTTQFDNYLACSNQLRSVTDLSTTDRKEGERKRSQYQQTVQKCFNGQGCNAPVVDEDADTAIEECARAVLKEIDSNTESCMRGSGVDASFRMPEIEYELPMPDPITQDLNELLADCVDERKKSGNKNEANSLRKQIMTCIANEGQINVAAEANRKKRQSIWEKLTGSITTGGGSGLTDLFGGGGDLTSVLGNTQLTQLTELVQSQGGMQGVMNALLNGAGGGLNTPLADNMLTTVCSAKEECNKKLQDTCNDELCKCHQKARRTIQIKHLFGRCLSARGVNMAQRDQNTWTKTIRSQSLTNCVKQEQGPSQPTMCDATNVNNLLNGQFKSGSNSGSNSITDLFNTLTNSNKGAGGSGSNFPNFGNFKFPFGRRRK